MLASGSHDMVSPRNRPMSTGVLPVVRVSVFSPRIFVPTVHLLTSNNIMCLESQKRQVMPQELDANPGSFESSSEDNSENG